MERTASKLSLARAAEQLYPRKWPLVRRMTEIVQNKAPLAKRLHQWIEKQLPPALRLPAATKEELELLVAVTFRNEHPSDRFRSVGLLPEGKRVQRRHAAAELRYLIMQRYKRRRFLFLAQLSADLRQPGVIVTGRNRQGMREALDPTDIEGATLDIEANTIFKGRCCWDSVSVVLPQTLTEEGGVRQGDPEVDGEAAGIGVLATPGDAMTGASRDVEDLSTPAKSASRGPEFHARIRKWHRTTYPKGTTKPWGQRAKECASALGRKSLDERTLRRALGGK